MSLKGAVTRLNSTTRAMQDVKVRSLTEALEKELGSVNRMKAALPQIYQAAAKKLEPLVRNLLKKNYNAAGLKVKSGDLYKASVTNATVFVNARASLIIISMGAGADKDVYERAGAFRFGAVRNTQFRTTYTDLSTGETKSYKEGKSGVIGAKQKRTIKAIAFGTAKDPKGNLAKLNRARQEYAIERTQIVIAPKPPFFNLNGDIDLIERTFIELVQKEISAFLKGRKGAA